MNSPERFFHFSNSSMLELEHILGIQSKKMSKATTRYDPELLYVECQICGQPVLWERGKTTTLLEDSGIDFTKIDETCMILSEGCPLCHPEESDGFMLAVVRVAGFAPEHALQLLKPSGSA